MTKAANLAEKRAVSPIGMVNGRRANLPQMGIHLLFMESASCAA
jgi:hypothetical protein